jgi:acyl carrier protein
MSKVATVESAAAVPTLDTTQSDLFQKVRSIIADVLCVDQAKILPESDLVDDLGAESIDFVDLAFRVEEAFKISFGPENMEPVADGGEKQRTVQRLVDYISGQLQAK